MTTGDDAPKGRDFHIPELLDLMSEYAAARADAGDGKRDQGVAGGPIKDWLEHHPAEELTDQERNLRAFLQDRGADRRADWERMPDELILTLARKGCLGMDWTAFDTWATKAPWHLQVGDFLYTIPRAPSLQIVELSKRKGRRQP